MGTSMATMYVVYECRLSYRSRVHLGVGVWLARGVAPLRHHASQELKAQDPWPHLNDVPQGLSWHRRWQCP